MTRSPRRIDHLVLAVRDLEAAAKFYRELGFQVGARNRHPWGTENRIIQFKSSFLELITVGDAALIQPHRPGQFSFGAFVRDYLEQGEGLAMLVLDSEDAEADSAAFKQSAIGDFEPFHFERMARRPDGSETQVAFSLAFARDPGLPRAGFFVCQQHTPDAFWNTEYQRHDNGATNVASVMLEVRDPAAHERLLTAFTGVLPDVSSKVGLTFALQCGGRICVSLSARHDCFVAFDVAVHADGARNDPEPAEVGSTRMDGQTAFGVTIKLV